MGYQLAGDAVVSPQWLEKNLVFPDCANSSTFEVLTPLTQIGLNAVHHRHDSQFCDLQTSPVAESSRPNTG